MTQSNAAPRDLSPTTRSYAASERLLAHARTLIPLGAQTFSKSITQLPMGVSPFFAESAKGAHFTDVDGHVFLDFVNALAAVTLGHADPDVQAAVEAQLRKGTIYSLSHRLEADMAERIVAMVPCAEMVRFGKNGSDATAGAIRVARAYTGRDHVLSCGYHGWQDWYIGATARNKGVPQATRDLTHLFAFNDLASVDALLDKFAGQVAAIILEPMNVMPPAPGFLEGLRARADAHGIVLIFDETITGFRFANGGAQDKFGVTPDLATFGKGVANGFPLSVIAGKRALMMEMEEIFFSFTMGGETLSLAAGCATLDKLMNEPVIPHMQDLGAKLKSRIGLSILASGADFLSVSGDDTWGFLNFKDAPNASMWELKTLFLQEMFARGIYTLGTLNMSYAHTDTDISDAGAMFAEVIDVLAASVREGAVAQRLRCAPLVPLFKVR